MKHLLKIVALLSLVILFFNRNYVEEYLGYETIEQKQNIVEENPEIEVPKGDYLVNDSLYRWDTEQLNWITVKSSEKSLELAPKPILTAHTSTEAGVKPIPIDWELLLDIEYMLKYYEVLDMKIYAPVFTDALKAIDGKEVIIEGFVIPFDESGEILALSANPYASCFFCGKASPASVISLYLKKKKLYKMDDFRKFRGVLKLNYDDPEEYYYILNDARSIK